MQIHAQRYLTGSVSLRSTRLVALGYHRANTGSPLLTQAEFRKLTDALARPALPSTLEVRRA